MLPTDSDSIHFEKFEKLLRDYFEIDSLSSNVVVSYLLNKNHSFNLIKIDSIMSLLYGYHPSESD